MKILTIFLLLLSTSSYGRNLLQEYGDDIYMVDVQMGNLKKVRNSMHEYERKMPAMSLGVYGRKTVISIYNQNTHEAKQYTHAYWSGYTILSQIDNNEQIENMFGCYENAVPLLDSVEADEESDIAFSAGNLRKWKVYQEPKALRINRHQIYSMRRGIRAINRNLDVAEQEQNSRAQRALNRLKSRTTKKLDKLYKIRNKLLSKNKKWQPRRYFWINMTYHSGECVVREAHEVAITPMDKILEKLEALRRKYSLEL